MGNQDRAEDLETLLALLADIETDLAAESEGDKGRIRELRQHCMLRLALLAKSKKKDPE